MSVSIQGMQVPEGATLDIRISLSARANITAFVARQKVTQFVIQEISSQLGGGAPDLMVGERLCWSVPVLLTSPAKGIIGRVGEIQVDATTGEILADAATVEGIAANAERLAQRSPL
jgi:hypothetical protein